MESRHRCTETRNVLFFLWRSTGHVHASFGVAKRLVRFGFNVVYLGPSDLKVVVEQQGFSFYQLGIFDQFKFPVGIGRRPVDLCEKLFSPKALYTCITSARNDYRKFIAAIPSIVQSVDQVLEQFRPAFLLFDPFLLYFYIPAYRHTIPAVALSTKNLATEDVDVPPYTQMQVPDRSLGSRISIAVAWKLQHLKYKAWTMYERVLFGCSPFHLAKHFAEFCRFPLDREWATRPILTDLRFNSVPEWVLHIPEFDFPRTKVENAFFVGPCVDIQRVESPFNWNDIPPGRLIVCVLTSVFHPGTRAARYRLRFVRELLQCMRTLPEFVLILASGRGLDLEAAGLVPPNVRVYESIPAIQVMQRAELLMTQGGGNIAKEAILTGTKMLTFPAVADQPGFSARLAYHKLSRRCHLKDARACGIKELILKSLSDSTLSDRIADMASKFASYEHNDLPLKKALEHIGLKPQAMIEAEE